MAKREEWLIVDGYNVIGAISPMRLHPTYLDEERNHLIRDLSEYQAVTGQQVIVVFDAHFTKTSEVKSKQEKVTIYYTQYDETADAFIERFVKKHKNPFRVIYVATSDQLEQRIVFGQGAYRKSARELIEEIELSKNKLSKKLEIKNTKKPKGSLAERLSDELKKELEKLRRKK
ncbi:NYN domain-containing protein [Hazenella sp. IB182357]|uniref:NYN domain-containing protein n=1 Tax=Polycladospora coralii TaxID=2771432 RepID=A0A926NB25_9BACL|nr:NYN domain-containing protein [Polycladospora coralii]MBD1372385.1 NYN domain-containing protein [Polycladospora coralii]MBS7531425.1 NYN domain-containing protein [Polycladospora coralii]